MAKRNDEDPRPLMVKGAIYQGDNGRFMCDDCAGASARFTLHDLSGQPVPRLNRWDVEAFAREVGRAPSCECGRVTLATIAGPDGWPLAMPADALVTAEEIGAQYAEARRLAEESTRRAIAAAVESAKTEIVEDVRAGTVPADVPSFSALHDHVDANGYGGLLDAAFHDAVGDYIAAGAEVQDAVDEWIRGGGIRAALARAEGGAR